VRTNRVGAGSREKAPSRSLPPAAVAVIAVTCGVALRVVLEPILRGSQIWLTFWPAVFLAAWFGGWRAGAATLLVSIAIVVLWMVPLSPLAPSVIACGAVVFFVCGASFSYMVEIAQRGRLEEHRLREATETAYADEHRVREGYLAFAKALSNASTPEEVAQALVQEGAAALGAEVGVLAQIVEDSFEIIAQHGLVPPLPRHTRFPIGSAGPLGAVLRSGREHFAETADEFHSLFRGAIGIETATSAAAALPLKVGERVVGAVALRFGAARPFSAAERDLLRTLVAQTAQAFERATLFQKEHVFNRRMRALVDLASVLASSESLDDVAHAVVSEGKRASGADTCMLYVHDDAQACLRLIAERGCAPEIVEQVREIALDSDQGRRLAAEQWIEASEQYRAVMPELAEAASSHPRAASFWSIPLVAEGLPGGILAMGFYHPQLFPPEEREFARLFARHCAQAVARAERSSRVRLERLRLERIFDANLIGTVFWERGRITRANESFLRSIGYTQADLAAGAVDWRKLTPAEFEAADRAAIQRVLASSHHEPYEKAYVHKDGHRVPVLVASAAFFDDPHQGVTYVADLTEVKRAAQAADRAKDEFLAMLGHELRNPLAPITTALELIELRGLTAADRPLAIIRRQVRHLTALVDDLLDVSRIRSAKVQLARRPHEVSELLGGALETVSPLITERRHQVAFEVPVTGLVVDVDATRMGQVLTNILTNAAKYTDPAGQIRVGARRDGDHVVIDIADTGVGIDPALLPRIFDLFTQAPQSTDRSRGGLGLGLAIARAFVQLHGGSITAHSEGNGTGSQITVRLPLAVDLASGSHSTL
jgi:PAS domain S-box-containing protein